LIVVSKAEIGVVELAGTLPAPGALLSAVFDASRRGTSSSRFNPAYGRNPDRPVQYSAMP
jgi:hypothetical protein